MSQTGQALDALETLVQQNGYLLTEVARQGSDDDANISDIQDSVEGIDSTLTDALDEFLGDVSDYASNKQIYDELTDEETGLSAIKDAVDNIELDTTDLAKQGTDPDISLTSIDGKIDDFYNTFDADIAYQLNQIIGDNDDSEESEDSEELPGTSTQEQLERLRTLQESYDVLNEKYQTMADAWEQIINSNILRPDLQGIVFVDGRSTNNAASLLLESAYNIYSISSSVPKLVTRYTFQNCTSLYEVNLPNVETIDSYAFYGCTNLQNVNIPNATGISSYAFHTCTKIQELDFPNVTAVGTNVFRSTNSLISCNLPRVTYLGQDVFTGSSIRKLYIPRVSSFGGYNPFPSTANLIDITIGVDLNVSLNLSVWNPTNAYSSVSNNLVPNDVLVEHPTWHNSDYLLYCIREHIAANLPDLTGSASLTMTFYSTMKNLIQTDQATMDAFTNKNWTIA